MDKKVLSIVLVVLLAIGGSAAFLMFNNADEKDENTSLENTSNTQEVASAGAYVDYSPSVIANTDGTKVLFFHAAWCPQCRELEADIKSNGVPSGVTIIKVDYDNSQSLRQKYGVTLQTTLVLVDDAGELVKKFVAYDEPSLEAVKRNLL